jgi:hypothetical protein
MLLEAILGTVAGFAAMVWTWLDMPDYYDGLERLIHFSAGILVGFVVGFLTILFLSYIPLAVLGLLGAGFGVLWLLFKWVTG